MGTRVDASPEESDGACYTDADNVGSRHGPTAGCSVPR